jgi:TolB-like protein/DNA-binding winged helix-turn-helix (wHTH) protein
MNSHPTPVDLAHEPDFFLGTAKVQPSLRIFAVNGTSEIIEPRVMQALVWLARRAGEVVGRDELVATCWEGRVVGEDAIQRAIAKVRKLGDLSGAFAIQTIPRVGYRLKACEPADSSNSATNASLSDQRAEDGGNLVDAVALTCPRGNITPSLAVLPFVNRTGFEEDDVFADGLAEDLTTAIAANRFLRILASNASAIYREGTRNIREIGRDLGVRFLLQGTVKRAHDLLRVSPQLVDAESGNILWTQKFERPFAEVPALQEDLVTEIAAHLGVQVEHIVWENALGRPGEVNAWEARMRAVAYLSRMTQSGHEMAVAEARHAVDIDRDDASSVGSLVIAQSLLLIYQADETGLRREIIENIRRARALGPYNPIAIVACATAMVFLGMPEDAVPHLERLLITNPSVDYVHIPLGLALARLGRLDEALAMLEEAECLRPNSILGSTGWVWRSAIHLQRGQCNEAQEEVDKALMLAPSSTDALVQSMLCTIARNDRSHALHALHQFRAEYSEAPWWLIEKFIRFLHGRSHAVVDYIANVRELWDENTN